MRDRQYYDSTFLRLASRGNCVSAIVGERLTDADVDTILKLTGTEEDLDGNIKYEGSISIFRRRNLLIDASLMLVSVFVGDRCVNRD